MAVNEFMPTITKDTTYLVEFSYRHSDVVREWRVNASVTVLCDEPERAIVLVKEQYEEARVHMIKRLGTRTVIVDSLR